MRLLHSIYTRHRPYFNNCVNEVTSYGIVRPGCGLLVCMPLHDMHQLQVSFTVKSTNRMNTQGEVEITGEKVPESHNKRIGHCT
jgi:hypothetical protein